MLRCLPISCLFCFLAIAFSSVAQVSNLRKKKIATAGAIVIDSVSIVPGTLRIENTDTSFYLCDFINASLIWKKPMVRDSVFVQYRVFSSRLNAAAQRFSFDSIHNNFMAERPKRNGEKGNSLFNFGNITYNGSFGRSLSVGNTQDAVFNSQLNLQINGLIGDSIQIAAAITDNNIPIQPDGTTQQLNEFDKILLQFKKHNWEMNLGDIDLRRNNAYFLKFYKRLQGISYEQHFDINKKISDHLLVSGAIAKGKFARNILPVQEGNQGPYRLQGNNNELYFVVLAGTEKVFIDGAQMQRGEDQDYIINYNTAEITFTPKQLITKDRRIQVEFEYADRNFLNSMLYGSNTVLFGKKFTLNVSAYSNADAKSSPINQTLDTRQKQFLANLGDSIQNAFYPVSGIDSFSAARILYKKIDTVYNNVHDSVYIYSTNKDSAKYDLSFIEVGFNKGNYILSSSAANGKVYQWIAPQNGIPQGFYEAAAFLVTPKQQQVISINGEYKIDDNTVVSAEIASSKNDVNTFSEKNEANDIGYAGKISFTKKTSWQNKSNKPFFLTGSGSYEWVDKKFRPVERLRAVEFTRDWGLPIITNYATEQLPELNLQLEDDKNNSVQYQFGSYLRGDGYKGYRNIITHNYDVKGWHLYDVFNLTNVNLPLDKGFFLRPSVDISKTIYKLYNYVAGASYALEHNEIKNNITDTITPVSFAFETISAYLKSDQSKADKWSVTYFTRNNKLPYGSVLTQTDRSHNYNFQTELLQNQNHQFRLNVTYRQLFVTNSKLISQTSDNSLLGRAEYAINEWNGFINGNLIYEIGAGQEQKRDYSYIEVAAGLGQYAWNDYNGDGIPQLNEFEIALFQDQAKYIRIFTPTNQYIKASYNQFTYSLSVTPKAIANKIRNKQFKNLITRFYLQSSLQTGQKQIAGEHPLYNPFGHNISDTSLLTLNYIISNTLAFNRSSPVWGADVTQLTNYNKSLLTYGFESRRLQQWNGKAHINLKKVYTLEIQQSVGSNSLLTPSFGNRNYFINLFSVQPRLAYTAGTKFRVQTSYNYEQKNNDIAYGGEKAVSHAFTIESRYNAVSNASLNAKFTLNNITYTGAENTTTSYIMLGGLLPGKNYLWNINFTKRLINNLELNFEYEGRKPGNTRTINIGRASVRALF